MLGLEHLLCDVCAIYLCGGTLHAACVVVVVCKTQRELFLLLIFANLDGEYVICRLSASSLPIHTDTE